MTSASSQSSTIIRTEGGLIIAGTRITLYDVMDYLVTGYPSKLIQEKLCLSDAQLNMALSYIDTHRAEVETEYQEVLQLAEDNQRYWEERNREHFVKIAAKLGKTEHKALWDKLEAWKERLNNEDKPSLSKS